VHQVLAQIAQRSLKGSQSKTVELTKGWRAQLLFREVRIEQSIGTAELHGYEHQLVIPGEVRIPELATTIRARISEDNGVPGNASYNRAHSICLPEVSEVVVRNWRAGDRFRPARHLSEKRVKELLYPLRLRPQEKQLWPVVAAGGTVLWVRGIESPELRTASGQRLCIEETVD
jgi:tRNA(Ile)-lysidine synthetase-like protein